MINPDEKTTALGGVATGNIKAQLAANVTGTHKTTGEIPIWSASAPRIGKKVAVVARLLVISVKKITRAVAQNTTNPTPINDKGDKLCPNQLANPLLEMADARLKPPPNKIRTPQGNPFKSSQTSNLDCPLSPLGNIKRRRAPVNAIEASDKP